MEAIYQAAIPHLLEIFGIVATAFIGWASAKARKKWGLDIQARWRETLHSALLTGAQLALERKLTGKDAIKLILSHVTIGAGDAVKGLGANRAALENLARAKLQQVTQDALTSALSKALSGK